MEIKCIWEHNGNDTLLYAGNFIGAFSRGETKEVALSKMENEVKAYLRWERGAQEILQEKENMKNSFEITISQEKVSSLDICDADSDVIFNEEKGELTLEEYKELKELVLKYRESCYPVLDESEKIVGVLTRYHLLRHRKKRVVLVDHNEAAQSVPGLEEAEIMEIIDHHRLADIQTSNPIFVRNEPVGSTNTIIASMFQDKGLIPSEKLAGMMAAAILSDTVMFKSPTCTVRDIRTAERMARIADISLEELGRKIFSASIEGKTAKELLFTDYKEFHIAGHDLAVAQVTCVDSANMLSRKEELLSEMKAAGKKKGVSLVILMLTDVLLEGTQLLYVGEDDVISQAFGVTPKDNEVFLPKVMSRKKQIIPSLSALWG